MKGEVDSPHHSSEEEGEILDPTSTTPVSTNVKDPALVASASPVALILVPEYRQELPPFPAPGTDPTHFFF